MAQATPEAADAVACAGGRGQGANAPIVNAVFEVEARDAARAFILRLASDDRRVTAGALVGSFAREAQDRWSDLDLTFAVADQIPIGEVITDWTRRLEEELGAVPIWDVQVRNRTYRVFVLPGSLQVDLSFTAASQFRPAGPSFTLLFGEAGPTEAPSSPTPEHFFGLGVVQALHARRCIERARWWQAVAMLTLKDGKIWRETDYFAAPFDVPDWRRPFVELEPADDAAEV